MDNRSGGSSNGRTPPFGGGYDGSNPSPPAKFDGTNSEFCKQLEKALKIINKAGQGVLIYLYQEGRGINIINKIDAYNLQRKGADTVMANELLKLPPDMREYTAAKDILSDLGVRSVKILTNNPDKIYKLEELGIIIESSIPLEIRPHKYNKKYLATKKNKMGHTLKLVK